MAQMLDGILHGHPNARSDQARPGFAAIAEAAAAFRGPWTPPCERRRMRRSDCPIPVLSGKVDRLL
jgi:hypothetical protein